MSRMVKEDVRRLARVLSAPEEAGDSFVLSDGRVATIERDVEPGVRVRTRVAESDASPAMTALLLEPSDVRPDAWPDELPFVPNAKVVVMRTAEALTAAWSEVEDTAAFVDAIVTGSVESGWVRQKEIPSLLMMGGGVVLERDGIERSVSASMGSVLLIQPAKPEGSSPS